MSDLPRLVSEPGVSLGGAPTGATALLPVHAKGDEAQLLAAIVESAEVAILSKDLDGVITSWNAGAERIYGYSAREVIGQPISMLVPSDAEDDTPLLLARLRKGERISHYETLRLTRDDRRITVSLAISPIVDGHGRVVGASTIARDITERDRELSRWRLLSEASETLGYALDSEELLRDFARVLVREMADYAVTYLLEEGTIRRVGAAHADPGEEDHVLRLTQVAPPTLEDQYGAGAVIRTGEPILAKSILPGMLEAAASAGGGDRYLQILKALQPVSSIVLPLTARGRTVGAVALAATARSNRHYDEADLVLGRELADRAAMALDNARLYGEARRELNRREAVEESLSRRYSQLGVLYQMTEAVGRAAGAEEIYECALDGLHHGLNVDRASILLFDADGVMRFKAWRGLSESYRRAVEGHSPWRQNARNPTPIAVADVSADPDLDPGLRATVLEEGIRAMAFIPIVFAGRILGKFMLYFQEPHLLDENEMELARSVAGTVAFAITRIRDERGVRDAKEEAERANKAKSQFLGIMSHELRTPLNAVLGYVELLLLETKGPINAGQREQLDRVQISARHQLDLVDELLTYTRLEAGREEPNVMESDVRRVINDVAELVRPEADKKGLRLSVDIPPQPLQVRTDPAKLRQIALNLAANATKYTDSGEVAISAQRDGDHLRVEVRDSGPGIPEDRLEYIFEPFTRVDESRTRSTAGTGLGLAIARRLATLLDGEVQVRSRVGEGSVFILRIPGFVP